MMKRTGIASRIGVGAALLLAAGVVSAQSSGGTGTPQYGDGIGSPASSPLNNLPSSDKANGRVQSVNPDKQELTIAGSKDPLKVNSGTQILRDGQGVSLKEIKPGDTVHAAFISDDTFHPFLLAASSPEGMSTSGSPTSP